MRYITLNLLLKTLLLIGFSFSLGLLEAQTFEKSHVTTDKNIYAPEDTLWFKAYIFDKNNRISDKSVAYHVLMADSSGNKKVDTSWPVVSSIAEGYIPLPESEGKYTLMGVSGQMLGADSTQFFSKTIFIRHDEPDPVEIGVFKRFEQFHPDSLNQFDIYTLDVNDNPIEDTRLEYQIFDGSTVIDDGRLRTNEEGKVSLNLEDLEPQSRELGLLVTTDNRDEIRVSKIYTPVELSSKELKIDLQFFPEGGHLIADMENKIAFKAIDHRGEPQDFKAVVFDQNEDVIDTISSIYKGMGSFMIEPFDDDRLFAKIISPVIADTTYRIPNPVVSGLLINKESAPDSTEMITVRPTRDLLGKEAIITLWRRDELLMEAPFELLSQTAWKIPENELPTNIYKVKVSLKDNSFTCERLFFSGLDSELNIDIALNQDQYLQRDKAEVQLKVTDAEGAPVQGSFSFAVINEEVSKSPVDDQPHLLSQILLNSELKGHIPTPNFYFSNDPKAESALDLVMLTNGWRKYSGSSILDPEIVEGQFVPKGRKEEPVQRPFTIQTKVEREPLELNSGKQGYFNVDYFYLKNTGDTILIKAQLQDEKEEIWINLNKEKQRKKYQSMNKGLELANVHNSDVSMSIFEKDYKLPRLKIFNSYFLNTLEIENNRILPRGSCQLEEILSDERFITKTADELDLSSPNVLDWIKQVSDDIKGYGVGKHAGNPYGRDVGTAVGFNDVITSTKWPYFYGLTVNCTAITVGGVRFQSENGRLRRATQLMNGKVKLTIESIDWTNIKSISVMNVPISDLVRRNQLGEVIGAKIPLILLRTENEIINYKTTYDNEALVRIYKNTPVQYYSPLYDTPERTNSPIPDLRTTLYWNANLKTDENGEAKVSFYNSDRIGKMKIRVDGVDTKSRLGIAEKEYTISVREN